MRDMEIHIDQGRKIIDRRPYADLNFMEINELFKDFNENERRHGRPFAIFNMINDVYQMGIARGYRTGYRDRDS